MYRRNGKSILSPGRHHHFDQPSARQTDFRLPLRFLSFQGNTARTRRRFTRACSEILSQARCILQTQPLRCVDYVCRSPQTSSWRAAEPLSLVPFPPAPFSDRGFHAGRAYAPLTHLGAHHTNLHPASSPDPQAETKPRNFAAAPSASDPHHGLLRAASLFLLRDLPVAPQIAQKKTATRAFCEDSGTLPGSSIRIVLAHPCPSSPR